MSLLFQYVLLMGTCLALVACTSQHAPASTEDSLYLDSEIGWNWKTDGESQVRRYLLALDPEWGWVYEPLAAGEEEYNHPSTRLEIEIENSLRVDTATAEHRALIFDKLARVCALNLAEPSTYDSLQITYNEGEWTHRYAVSSFSPPAYWETESRKANENPEGE